ncbi:hypothetical protein ES703_03125 [subsurface metagenome]
MTTISPLFICGSREPVVIRNVDSKKNKAKTSKVKKVNIQPEIIITFLKFKDMIGGEFISNDGFLILPFVLYKNSKKQMINNKKKAIPIYRIILSLFKKDAIVNAVALMHT